MAMNIFIQCLELWFLTTEPLNLSLNFDGMAQLGLGMKFNNVIVMIISGLLILSLWNTVVYVTKCTYTLSK